MADETTTTKRDSTKIEKQHDVESLVKLVKFIRNAGLAGTLTIAGLVAGGVKWLDDRISASVSEAVRKELDPIEKRLTRLELREEMRKEKSDK